MEENHKDINILHAFLWSNLKCMEDFHRDSHIEFYIVLTVTYLCVTLASSNDHTYNILQDILLGVCVK